MSANCYRCVQTRLHAVKCAECRFFDAPDFCLLHIVPVTRNMICSCFEPKKSG